MEEKRVIQFELLGVFSYDDESGRRTNEHGSAFKAGKKTLSFLQYLIVNHERSISSEELIERFWTEKSNAPGNALRHMLFKVRNLLKSIFPECEEPLLTLPGCYIWNPDICLRLDTEQFEAACLEARKESGENRLSQLLLAASLYKGDFLAANDHEWAMSLRQYYRALYLDVCKAVLPLLEKREQWMDMIGICEQAYRADFSMEEFTAYWMRALIVLNQPEQAVERYEAYRERMLKELDLPPGKYIEQIYTLAAGLRKKDMGIPDIFKLVCEGEAEEKAFFCTFEVFQSIVALERRHLARTRGNSALAIVSLGRDAVPVTDARRLERILQESLRGGDPVARLEAGSYILMLTGASTENARLVLNRIDCAFHRTYRHSRASITYRITNIALDK